MKEKKIDWRRGLDDDQLDVVTATTDKPVVVLAGPGSGKTLVATRRVAWLVAERGIDPTKIAAVTFSWNMANELSEKVLAVCPLFEPKNVCTIHAFCFRLLKSWGDARVKVKDWRVRAAIQSVIEDKNWKVGTRTVRWWIDKAKNEGVGDDIQGYYVKALQGSGVKANDIDHLVEAYARVERALQEDNALTFPDMLRDVWTGLKLSPKTLRETQQVFQYVVVDEGQDTFELPMSILKLIGGKNLMIVGDADQLLYRFSGAAPEDNLFSLNGSAQIYKLQNNYRSVPSIVAATSKLIGLNYVGENSKFRKELVPVRPYTDDDDGAIEYEEYEDAEDEATKVADNIEMFHKPGDVYVGARTNAQLAAIERELRLRKVPYVTNSDDGGFFSKPHVRDVIAYMKLIWDETNDEAFERVYNIASNDMRGRNGQYSPTRWLGAKFLEAIMGLGDHYLITLFDHKWTSEVGYRYAAGIDDLVKFVKGLKLGLSYGMETGELMRRIIDDCYRQYYLATNGLSTVDPSDETAMDDLESLVEIAREYVYVEDFLKLYDKMVERESKKDREQCVVLSTIHKLKGAERPVVFGIGWSEGLLPHSQALTNGRWTTPDELNVLPIPRTGSVEDERCIAFVLATRAKDKLYISSIRNWRGKEMQQSRFVKELLS